MANNKDELMMSVNFNKKLAQQAQDSLDSLYKSTYFTDNKDKQYIENIRDRMSKNINSLIDNVRIRTGSTNISDLYARTLAKDSSALTVAKDISDASMITDIMDLYSANMLIRDLDREIDVILKYIPRLQKAQDLIETSILAADHANEDDIDIHVVSSIKDTEGEVDNASYANNDKTSSMVKKYDLKKLKKTLLNRTNRYGERFVYITSYSKSLSRLLKKKDKIYGNNASLSESVSYLSESVIEDITTKSSIILETTYLDPEKGLDNGILYDMEDLSSKEKSLLESHKDSINSLKIEINDSGVIPSIVAQASNTRRVLSETASLFQEVTVKSDYGLAKDSEILRNSNKLMKKYIKDSLHSPDDKLVASDGLTTQNDGYNVDVGGCIVEQLDHEHVKPLYIDNRTCIGYYYIEYDKPMDTDSQAVFSSTIGGMRARKTARDRSQLENNDSTNEVLKKIARQISSKIDAKFINANQDLAEEIYAVLKYNESHGDKISKVRVSFIPPEDMVHSYFDMDDRTHRGISIFDKSLFPGKLFSCLYISNVIALLTRGYDKRIYRVRNVVDTNITATLMNVINQIKQSNFNLRQVENMNNILNITGRFNDLVVPQSANGESPISTEVIPGQNVDIKTEFMNQLEEMAVEQLVSMEMITNHFQSEQSATNVVQNNERFLIMIREKQRQYEEILSTIFTKIYQYEYGTNDIVEVELPAPRGLNFSNTSQLLATGNDLIQNIVQMQLGSNPDETLKAKYTEKLMKYYYSTLLPMEDLSRLLDEAKIELETEKNGNEQDNNTGGGY